MSTIIYDGDFDTAALDGNVRLISPFAGDNTTYIAEFDFIQKFATYSRQSIGAPVPDAIVKQLGKTGFSSFLLAEESDITPVGGGLVKFTRTYARVPYTRADYESFAWRVPGRAADVDSVFNVTVTAFTNQAGGTTKVTTATDHFLSSGSSVSLSYNIKLATGSQITRTVVREVIDVLSSKTFTVELIPERPSSFNQMFQAAGRDPVTQVVASKIVYDYFLVGSANSRYPTPEAIDILPAIEIVNSLGAVTETFSPTTIPTLSEWDAKRNAKDWVIAEASIIRRWKGNIFERATRYVRAQ